MLINLLFGTLAYLMVAFGLWVWYGRNPQPGDIPLAFCWPLVVAGMVVGLPIMMAYDLGQWLRSKWTRRRDKKQEATRKRVAEETKIRIEVEHEMKLLDEELSGVPDPHHYDPYQWYSNKD